ncbi:DUF3592 domain-containing protein [Hymenobacter crusticola]|uniref:DUF3592 domain-containing protein n=1 Tax=Hymenobacter crusticola TaxID=1770526 RepID=A0A243WH75_9BACT|nr:DUF3592 domain-containing protein [Hymenobacter crusticola]OUJ74857.1 hypothetical protein BXP70_08890 [Hymenobacter crusticola]
MDLIIVFWFILVASLATIHSLKVIRRSRRLFLKGIKAQGIIVGKTWTNGNTRSVVLPVIQFITTDGDVVKVTGNFGMSIPTFYVGERVTLFYDAQNPQHFDLDSGAEKAAPFLIIFVACVIVVTAVVL